MITDVEIAKAILEIVTWAADEDVTNPREGIIQLFGLRMSLRAMGVNYTWHREVAAWQEVLRKYEVHHNLQEEAEAARRKVLDMAGAAVTELYDEGYAFRLDPPFSRLCNAREVLSDTVPDGVRANH